jgi:hypothetical protein
MRHLLAFALTLVLALELAGPALARPVPEVKAEDFRCLLDGRKPEGRNFFVFHRNKMKLRRAVRMSVSGKIPKRGYPVGTILQVLPFEAMVKRPRGYNPDGNDWEFVRLKVSPDGSSEITAAGRAEVSNALGSCQGCHKLIDMQVTPSHDLVCGFVIGANGLGLTDEQLAAIQAGDPRCK